MEGEGNNPISWNAYLYANGNPLVYIDRNGYESEGVYTNAWQDWKIGFGMVAGGALNIAESTLGIIQTASDLTSLHPTRFIRGAKQVDAGVTALSHPGAMIDARKKEWNEAEEGARREIREGNHYTGGVALGHDHADAVMAPAGGAGLVKGLYKLSRSGLRTLGDKVASVPAKVDSVITTEASADMGVGAGAAHVTKSVAAETSAGSQEATHTITIVGVRGGGGGPEADGIVHPYQYTGHVGYSFDGGKTIFGFGPNVAGAAPEEVIAGLKEGRGFPGEIRNDTDIFADMANSPVKARGGNGSLQKVYKQDISVTKEQFDAIKSKHDELFARGPMEDVRYSFPPKDGVWPPNTYNCATFPSCLGIPIPETSGALRNYMPALERRGVPWEPNR